MVSKKPVPSKQQLSRHLIPGKNYYYLELLGEPDGTNLTHIQSSWDGFEADSAVVEVRRACFVDPLHFIEDYKEWGISLLIVNTKFDAAVLVEFGGAAVVVEDIAHSIFKPVMGPRSVVRRGVVGFASVKPQEDVCRRTPSKKLRMRTLKRDQFRCRLCGRSAESSIDIELHVHHIRPVSQRGPTVAENLITLCGSCHEGLDPHFDPSLFDLVGVGLDAQLDLRAKIAEGRIQYRKNLLFERAQTESSREGVL
jgi:hypothetical protein